MQKISYLTGAFQEKFDRFEKKLPLKRGCKTRKVNPMAYLLLVEEKSKLSKKEKKEILETLGA